MNYLDYYLDMPLISNTEIDKQDIQHYIVVPLYKVNYKQINSARNFIKYTYQIIDMVTIAETNELIKIYFKQWSTELLYYFNNLKKYIFNSDIYFTNKVQIYKNTIYIKKCIAIMHIKLSEYYSQDQLYDIFKHINEQIYLLIEYIKKN